MAESVTTTNNFVGLEDAVRLYLQHGTRNLQLDETATFDATDASTVLSRPINMSINDHYFVTRSPLEESTLGNIRNYINRGDTDEKIRSVWIAFFQSIINDTFLKVHSSLVDAYITAAFNKMKLDFEESEIPRTRLQMARMGRFNGVAHSRMLTLLSKNLREWIQIETEKAHRQDLLHQRALQLTILNQCLLRGQLIQRDREQILHMNSIDREYTEMQRRAVHLNTLDNLELHNIRTEQMGNLFRSVLGGGVKTIEPIFQPTPASQIAGLALSAAGLYTQYRIAGQNSGTIPTQINTPTITPAAVSVPTINPTASFKTVKY